MKRLKDAMTKRLTCLLQLPAILGEIHRRMYLEMRELQL